MLCERCGKETNIHTMSYFNTEDICTECSEKERKHPKFKEAQDAEMKVVKSGDMNFPGIGKPDDL